MQHRQLALTFLLTFGLGLQACGSTFPNDGNPPPYNLDGGNYKPQPLMLYINSECNDTEVDELRYEVTSEGLLRFPKAGETTATQSRQLSSKEIIELDMLLETADLKAKQAQAVVIPDDAPQTDECRPVQVMQLQLQAGSQKFERNGRKLDQTDAFENAWKSIESKLESLAKAPAPEPTSSPSQAAYTYALPLTVRGEGECDLGNPTQYEVLADGTFRYAPEPQPGSLPTEPQPALMSRKLTADEQSHLLKLLHSLDLAKKFEDSKPIPADAPQTLECRTVQYLDIRVNGVKKSLDRNSRTLDHSQAYREAFQQLTEHLAQLARTGTPPASTSAVYALPLKVALDGECGLPDYTRYQLSADGTLMFAREDVPTVGAGDSPFAAGSPPMESRQLTPAEQQQVKDFLNRTQLLAQVASSEPVPADAPQTKECRTVTVYTLSADGQVTSFEGEGTRKFRHSEQTLNDLMALQALLKSLSKVS